jgi:DNA invertase Pin-like site-specific DNA recombinase
MATAYSYIRFSSPEQAKGDSLRRQAQAAAEWCGRHGIALDTTLTLHDLGTSAFTGDHRQNPDRHALAAFLELVRRGRVPRGSFLIVENLDRLSREDERAALGLWLSILDAGISIVQLTPETVFRHEKSEMVDVMHAIIELSRGHSESRVKSERVGAAWAEKRRRLRAGEAQRPTERMGPNAKHLTRRLPAWLRWEGGRVVVDEGRADAVRRVFELSAEGYGRRALTRKLNDERVPPISDGAIWFMTYVAKLLSNRQVLGEYQPRAHGRPDGPPVACLPRIVDDGLWHRARAAGELRRGRGGRPAKHRVNVFQGLLKCASDGSGLCVIHRGTRATIASYRAFNGARGRPYVSFPLGIFERAVLSLLSEVDPREVVGGSDAAARAMALAGRMAELEAKIAKLEGELEREPSDAILRVLRKHEANLKGLAEERAKAEQEAAVPMAAALGEAKHLLRFLSTDEERVRLRSALRRIITAIRCAFGAEGRVRVCYARVEFTSGARKHYVISYRMGTGGAAPSSPPSFRVQAVRSDELDRVLEGQGPDE